MKAKEICEVLSNNRGYYKEVFDMYNYLVVLMRVVEQERSKEFEKIQGSRTKKQMSDFEIMMGEKPKDQGVVTIEITPDDMKKAKKEKETRQQQIKERRFSLPSKSRSSTPTRK